MTYDLNDFKDPDFLTKCYHSQDNIILANRLVILSNGIGIVSLAFFTKGSTKKILLSEVCYCSKLDTKLIFLGILDQKSLSYLFQKGILEL